MLQPSYSELMDVIRKGDKLDGKITSRYTVVLAAAKRARQITDGANPLTYAPTDRAVSIAVQEMKEGKLQIKVQEDLLDGRYEQMIKDQYRYRGLAAAISKDDLHEGLKDNYEPSYPQTTDEDDPAIEIFDQPAFATPDEDDESVMEKDDFDIYGDEADDEVEETEIDE